MMINYVLIVWFQVAQTVTGQASAVRIGERVHACAEDSKRILLR